MCFATAANAIGVALCEISEDEPLLLLGANALFDTDPCCCLIATAAATAEGEAATDPGDELVGDVTVATLPPPPLWLLTNCPAGVGVELKSNLGYRNAVGFTGCKVTQDVRREENRENLNLNAKNYNKKQKLYVNKNSKPTVTLSFCLPLRLPSDEDSSLADEDS